MGISLRGSKASASEETEETELHFQKMGVDRGAMDKLLTLEPKGHSSP